MRTVILMPDGRLYVMSSFDDGKTKLQGSHYLSSSWNPEYWKLRREAIPEQRQYANALAFDERERRLARGRPREYDAKSLGQGVNPIFVKKGRDLFMASFVDDSLPLKPDLQPGDPFYREVEQLSISQKYYHELFGDKAPHPRDKREANVDVGAWLDLRPKLVRLDNGYLRTCHPTLDRARNWPHVPTTDPYYEYRLRDSISPEEYEVICRRREERAARLGIELK